VDSESREEAPEVLRRAEVALHPERLSPPRHPVKERFLASSPAVAGLGALLCGNKATVPVR